MKGFWLSLSIPWQVCLEQAWQAYCAGSLPIGAAIVDAKAQIIARGRNRRLDPRKNNGLINGSKLAHAELNALISLPEDDSARHSWSLYTTTEPCPLCVGALYMAGLRTLYYAAHDPWAGSVNLFGKTPYLSQKPIQVHHPEDPDLEAILVAVSVATFLEGRIERVMDVVARQKTAAVIEKKHTNLPLAAGFGEVLFAENTLQSLRNRQTPAKDVFDLLVMRWQNFNQNNIKIPRAK